MVSEATNTISLTLSFLIALLHLAFAKCFAQADCQKGVTEAKKPQKTPVPTIDGTGRPTASAIPTMSPTETSSPSVFTTKSPQLDPTMMPSSEYPTFKPTYAPCGGDPCPQFGHCRSAAGYCGPVSINGCLQLRLPVIDFFFDIST